ncbi:hypothetical protein [Helicobacter pylori]|uniref:Uncharacterized protein n=1 Tax=Helicobacter pylori Hp P-4 TaxID=992075 RepID=J0PYA7_HELPX|nr:hypothetical protein [Helicobacter pylori]EJC03621.1 hypothetical protein HPHPP4_0085 [Helicobacter pylori Hp P-4]EJC24184.1 hypothetical protein HPHPP4C_0125 [Helicobacter pylori Hp P-4c]EJC25399.1 hypothetical protein HPHPP4D_0123 [Helicobacter pylori Hp P-4d]
MEKLFEKILHEMRSRISFLLAFVVSLIVFIVNPKGVFHFIFESIFQYTQNKILSFSLSFFFIFFFFYGIFLIFDKVFLWYGAKKYEQNERDKIYQKTAHQIHQFPNEIKKELYECYSKKQNKIPRMKELDKLIGRLDLIGFFKLRDFFEPTKDDYIVKPDVLRAIKKYHKIAFKSVYWQQNK